MRHITKWPIVQVGHTLVLLSVLTLALLGQIPDSQAGWVTCPLENGKALAHASQVNRHLGLWYNRGNVVPFPRRPTLWTSMN